jgi:hypothetical protein
VGAAERLPETSFRGALSVSCCDCLIGFLLLLLGQVLITHCHLQHRDGEQRGTSPEIRVYVHDYNEDIINRGKSLLLSHTHT